MMNREHLEQQLSQLPLLAYGYADPKNLEFTQRVRWICQQECPMYGKTWACPPAVGSVEECQKKCLAFSHCLVIATMTEVDNIADIDETLATRPAHENITNQVRDLICAQGIQPYVLSTEACALCQRCAYLDGLPCRMPEKMHPCVESHGINVVPVMEALGIPFICGENVVTWVSLLFFND